MPGCQDAHPGRSCSRTAPGGYCLRVCYCGACPQYQPLPARSPLPRRLHVAGVPGQSGSGLTHQPGTGK